MKKKILDSKKWLIYSFVIFILIHAPKFIAGYPGWDTPINLVSDYMRMNGVGRWFFGVAKITLSSKYDLQWIEGIVAGIFIAFSSVMMLELLHIKTWGCRMTLLLLVAAFPSMTATFVYQFCAPAYMLALFLSIFSVYIVKESTTTWSVGVAAICLAFSLGCYQIYYVVALSMFLYLLLSKIIRGENLADCKKLIIHFFVAYIGGAVLYKFIDIVLQKIFKYTLGSYQGINRVGNFSWGTIISGVAKIVYKLFEFYFAFFNGSFYAKYETVIVVLFAVNVVMLVILNRRMKFCSKIMVIIIILICLPLTYSLYLVTDGSLDYHSLMVFGNIFIYILPLVLFEIASENKTLIKEKRYHRVKYYISLMAVVAVFFLGCYHAINANIIYKQMEQSLEVIRFQTTEILIKIDEISEADEEKIALVGSHQTTATEILAQPDTVGIYYDFFASQERFIEYVKYYYARNFEICDAEAVENIKKSEEFKNMSCYPKGEYVKRIDGIIVVKLSES